MSFLPKTRFGLLWRAFVAAILVVGFAAGAVATTGLLAVGHLAQELRVNAQSIKGLTLPAPGKPETLLLIGSDHRGAQFADYAQSQTDTMLLIRIDDASQTINVMSVPRDLDVIGASGYPDKLNNIYSTENGPAGLIKVLKTQVFPGLQINHVIDTSFIGFSDLINAIGCVYTNVDHRYYNVSSEGAYNYSSINIEPGYQKLCGGVHSATGKNSALAFVRFRHTDSDEVRNARQQDFLRWAKDGYPTSKLAANEGKLTSIFSKYTHTDKKLASEDGLLELFALVINAQSHSIRTIPFPEYFGPCAAGQTTPCYVYPCSTQDSCAGEDDSIPDTTIGQPTAATEAAYKQFITPTKAKASSGSGASGTTTTAAPPKTKHRKLKRINTNGLEADPGDGASQSAQLLGSKKSIGLPIYYPKDIVPFAGGVTDTYCFTISDNCNLGYEPVAAFKNSYPRRYNIVAGAKKYASYVMTLQINRALGEYYTVQGTTWKNPPILNHPSKVLHLGHKTLLEYDNGSKIALVAFRTRKGVYWVSNSLNDVINNSAMIAMAAEMTQYVHKG